MLWNVCSVRPARAPRALRAPTSRCGARPPDAPWRRPTDQTSTLESPANGSRRMQSGRSERQHRPASQLPHECRSAGRTMDATDTAAPKTRYRGRSQALLYNTVRPHASLGYKPPAPEVFVPAFTAWPAALRQPATPATLAQRPALNPHSPDNVLSFGVTCAIQI